MKRMTTLKYLVLFVCCLPLSTLASSTKAATSKAEYCAHLGNPHAYQRQIEHYFNQLAFTNQEGLGLLGKGVCWWHSMFTRNATYFAVYRPDLQRPSEKEADRIIDLIAAGRGVVIIPGFRNLHEFSYVFANEIASKLERSQLTEGTIGFGWVRGLAGRSTMRAEKLEEKMHELYDLVKNQGQIVYQKLQMPGITAHSWLVTNMQETRSGYILTVVDSNHSRALRVRYTFGSNAMDYFGETHFAPYTSRNRDWEQIHQLQSEYCLNGKTAEDLIKDRRSARDSRRRN